MDSELTQLEKDILELRVKKGYTENETLEELNITKYQYNKIRKKLENLGLYSIHLVNKARKNRIARERYKDKKLGLNQISDEEEKCRKECVDILSQRYLAYNSNKKFNAILVSKLEQLSKAYSYNVILNTIKTKAKSLEYASKKDFNNDIAKISYLIAIIKNNAQSVYNQMKKQQEINDKKLRMNESDKIIIREMNNQRVSRPTRRRDLSEFLDD